MKQEKKHKSKLVRRVSLSSASLLLSSALLPLATLKASANEESQVDQEKETQPAKHVISTNSEVVLGEESQINEQANNQTQKAYLTLNHAEVVSQPSTSQPLIVQLSIMADVATNQTMSVLLSGGKVIAGSGIIKDATGATVGHFEKTDNESELSFIFDIDYQGEAIAMIPVSEVSNEQLVFSNQTSQVVVPFTLQQDATEQTELETSEQVTEQSETETAPTIESTTPTTEDRTTTSTEMQNSSISETSSSESATSTESLSSISEEQSATTESTTESTIDTESMEETTDQLSQESTENTVESTDTSQSESTEESSQTMSSESQVAPISSAETALPFTRAAQNVQQFIETAAAYAQPVAQRNGLYASVMIAQAALESGFGASQLSRAPNHNLFGIKGSFNGQSVTMPTWEVINGQTIYINAQFRKYPSYGESFQDNAHVLRSTSFSPGVYFYSGAWKENTTSYRDATAWLTGRYATDPQYGAKLNNIIERHNLTRFDTPNNNNNIVKPQQPSTPNQPDSQTQPTDKANYVVKRGDTLFGIARQHNVTVANLKAWNNLKSDLIFVGQKLVIKGTQSSTPSQPNKPSQPNANGTTHQVSYGDTLYRIALRHNVSVANLKAWNNLKSDLIFVGQKLMVRGTQTTPSQPQKPSQPGTSGSTHIVKNGDTLYHIARKHNVSVANLKSWNNLKSDLIFVNQQLTVKRNSSGQSTKKQHMVKSGDTLWAIAQRHQMSVNSLKNINNLKTDLIRIGQTLNV